MSVKLAGRNSMKRRCNICLQSKDHLKSDKFNNEVTVCYLCQKILTKIVYTNRNVVFPEPPII